MAFDEKKTKQKYWIADERGYERTKAYKIISQALLMIKQKNMFIVLVHKTYQSISTILVSFNDKGLSIDKPKDWPPKYKKIKVLYKDDAPVWNYFFVNIISSSKDTLKTDFPTELFRLQRRSHFRVGMPYGSIASFTIASENYTNVTVSNISIGGMMFCFERKKTISPGQFIVQDEIKHFTIQVPKQTDGPVDLLQQNNNQHETITVGRGKVARSFINQDNNKICLGVKFAPTLREEERLMQCIRYRELESLRKGIIGTL